MKRILMLILIFLVGCSNPDIIKLSPDTYMLFREDHRGIFGSPSPLKAGVISDANKFAEYQGKVAIPISSHFKPMGIGPAQWAEFEYQFRTNSLGFRDKERPLKKPKNNYRIFVTGDSFTEGNGVDEESRFTNLLEKK